LPQLLDHVRMTRPNLILVELTPDITGNVLGQLRVERVDAPAIIWVDTVSAEFASQAIAAGGRGILRRSLPIDLQIKCLRKMAAGALWVEETLSEQILCARRVALTRRESQLVTLLVQGLRNKEIAYSMGIGEGTVKVYLSRIFQKVGATDRFELALFALKNIRGNEAGRPNLNMAGVPSIPEVPAWVPRGERVQAGARARSFL
jgi:two-component system nitrate/nitrite response regulator NarL